MFIMLLGAQAFGQNRTVTGVVKDAATGETIPGASVMTKEDRSLGTATDINGEFKLEVPANTQALMVRSVGYAEIEVALTTSAKYEVMLTCEDYNLDAIVVSASRRQEKILDAPASITLISPEQIKNTVAITPIQNIKGDRKSVV